MKSKKKCKPTQCKIDIWILPPANSSSAQDPKSTSLPQCQLKLLFSIIRQLKPTKPSSRRVPCRPWLRVSRRMPRPSSATPPPSASASSPLPTPKQTNSNSCQRSMLALFCEEQNKISSNLKESETNSLFILQKEDKKSQVTYFFNVNLLTGSQRHACIKS